MTQGDSSREIVPIEAQRKMYVAKANAIIQKNDGCALAENKKKVSMTMMQSKGLLYLISKIKPNDKIGTVYHVSMKEFCQVMNIDVDGGKSVSEAMDAIQALANMSVWVVQPNKDRVLLRWLDRVRLRNKTGDFEITFHRDMMPYLFALQDRYTQYQLDNILPMQSKYAVRLYELLLSYRYQMGADFTFDDLRVKLDAEKYVRYPDFRRYVLEPAVADINTCSDIKVSYNIIRGSRNAVLGIDFAVSNPSVVEMYVRKRNKENALSPEVKETRQRRVALADAIRDRINMENAEKAKK